MYSEYSKGSLRSPEIIVLDYITFYEWFLSRIENRLPVNHYMLNHLDFKNNKKKNQVIVCFLPTTILRTQDSFLFV